MTLQEEADRLIHRAVRDAAAAEGVDLVYIERIDKGETRHPAVMQHLVQGRTVGAPSRVVQYSTVNPHRSALCDWARQTEQAVKVTWRRTAYGREIVNVERTT